MNLAVDITGNPFIYDPTVKDILRGIMEGITLLCVLFFTITEICNIAMYVNIHSCTVVYNYFMDTILL